MKRPGYHHLPRPLPHEGRPTARREGGGGGGLEAQDVRLVLIRVLEGTPEDLLIGIADLHFGEPEGRLRASLLVTTLTGPVKSGNLYSNLNGGDILTYGAQEWLIMRRSVTRSLLPSNPAMASYSGSEFTRRKYRVYYLDRPGSLVPEEHLFGHQAPFKMTTD